MRVASLGGSFEDAQNKGVFEPFEKESGIKVKLVAYTGPSQVVAQQRTGNIEWDAIVMSKGAMLSLNKQGYVEKIDYDRIDKRELAGIPNGTDPSVRRAEHPLQPRHLLQHQADSCGKSPDHWAEVWDTNKFPGQRSLGAFSGSLTPDLEFALLADGVPMDKLYPLDIDRAFKSLDRIRPSVAKFWTTGAMSPQMLTDGQISVGSAYINRIGDLIADRRACGVRMEPGQGPEQLLVHPEEREELRQRNEAHRAMRPHQAQAGFSTAHPHGTCQFARVRPPGQGSCRRILPSSPENLKKQFIYNDEWWADNRDAVQKRWDQWALSK